MKIGLGHLRMSPAVFWRLTLPEWFAAVDGYLESKGVKDGGRQIGPPSREECDALFAQLGEDGGLKKNG
jgi:uncharacterized phage protein (TIGR02216 family)